MLFSTSVRECVYVKNNNNDKKRQIEKPERPHKETKKKTTVFMQFLFKFNSFVLNLIKRSFC